MSNQKRPHLQHISRRKFIRNSIVITTGVAIAGPFLSGCQKDDFIPSGNFGFFEGVASFDPDIDRVILWTRYTQADNETESPVIILDVSKDDSFSQLVASESVEIDFQSDYTVTVDLSGLESYSTYFYRFRSEQTGATSIIGQTKTLPKAGDAAEVKLAVMSCANFQAGLFNVYAAVAETDADVVIHLGDYIYEYPAGGFGSTPELQAIGRTHDPEGELLNLDQYRARYRQYRGDEQLQQLHRFKPFICVWDDHEIANNAYRDGAENHQINEGDYEERKLAALQAWHEYLPARVDDQSKIYRDFDLGGIVHLLMLDTRIVGRDRQLNYFNYISNDGIDEAGFTEDWMDPQRTILGSDQKSWLLNALSSSTSNWLCIGSQVLMGKYYLPFELLVLVAEIGTLGVTPERLDEYKSLTLELVSIKERILVNDPTVTMEERDRVERVYPYNLDAWDGYPVERQEILNASAGSKLITLAGDTHNAWHSWQTDQFGNKLGAEFATPSISSPGFDGLFNADQETLNFIQENNPILIDSLQFIDASRRGFLTITFSESAAEAKWNFVHTVLQKDPTFFTGYTHLEM